MLCPPSVCIFEAQRASTLLCCTTPKVSTARGMLHNVTFIGHLCCAAATCEFIGVQQAACASSSMCSGYSSLTCYFRTRCFRSRHIHFLQGHEFLFRGLLAAISPISSGSFRSSTEDPIFLHGLRRPVSSACDFRTFAEVPELLQLDVYENCLMSFDLHSFWSCQYLKM